MNYLFTFVLIPLGVCVALALIVASIYLAYKRRRNTALLALAGALISIVIAGGSFVYLVVSGAAWGISKVSEGVSQGVGSVREKMAESRQHDAMWERHYSILKSHTAPADLLDADDRFWSDTGDGKRRKTPLVYPYRLETIDSLDWAFLARYESPDRAATTRPTSKPVLDENLVRVRTDGVLILYETVTGSFGIFEYRTGEHVAFKSLDTMLWAAKERGYKSETKLLPIKDCFETPFMAEPTNDSGDTTTRPAYE